MEIAAISNAVAILAVLACPVGMGLMMWMMARGSKRNSDEDHAAGDKSRPGGSVETLRQEQRRLAEEIDRLEGRTSKTEVNGEPRA